MENYGGTEESKVQKANAFIEGLKRFFKPILKSDILKPDNGVLILGEPDEKNLANNIATNIKSYKFKTIEANEALIAGSPLEIAIIENDKGEFIPIVGEKNYVELPSNILIGKRLSHNHPTNVPFSLSDIEVFIKGGLSEIRVVTKDGYKYLITNPDNLKLDFEAIKKTFDDSFDSALDQVAKKIMKGSIKKVDSVKEIMNIQWEETKKIHGFKYERIN